MNIQIYLVQDNVGRTVSLGARTVHAIPRKGEVLFSDKYSMEQTYRVVAVVHNLGDDGSAQLPDIYVREISNFRALLTESFN
jgi:hypothetical protein